MFFRSVRATRAFTRLLTALSGAALLAATLAASTADPRLPANVVRFTPQEMTLNDAQRAKLFAFDDAASGTTTTTEFTAPDNAPVPETPIDVAPAPAPSPGPCSPVITSAKGKLTSGGYIVLAGSCFGTSGNVVVSGFPNGDPKVTTQGWSPTLITIQLPKISGVPDLTMHVKVTTGALSSKTLDAKFVAALGSPVVLPTKYLANAECALYGACATSPHKPTGNHWDYSPQDGTDVWTLTLPEHFHLQTIHLVHIKTGPTKTTTVMSSGNQVAFKVAWEELQQNGSVLGQAASTTTYVCANGWFGSDTITMVNGVPTCGNTSYGMLSVTTSVSNPTQIPTWNNVYQVEAMVVGPDGMSP